MPNPAASSVMAPNKQVVEAAPASPASSSSYSDESVAEAAHAAPPMDPELPPGDRSQNTGRPMPQLQATETVESPSSESSLGGVVEEKPVSAPALPTPATSNEAK